MSYKAEVQVKGETSYNSNGLRFATQDEAEQYAKDLFNRWFAVESYRAAESDEPVTHIWNETGLHEVENKKTVRPLHVIAREIKKTWPNVWFGAVPYLDAMLTLDSMDDNYGLDTAKYIVSYFLANAATWRGEDARRIKAELKKMAGIK